MKTPHSGELARARELAEVAIADTALAVLAAVLRNEHPTLLDLGEGDAPSVLVARRVLDLALELRRELRRYRRATLLLDPPPPF